MKEAFKAVKVSEHVYWVGAIDWTVRDFHGYKTQRGSTYNAYLITAEKVTLVDTVKSPFKDEMFARIASVVEPSEIQYIVSNHAEMDHSGSLQAAIDLIQPEQVFASSNGVKALNKQMHIDRQISPVADGGTIDLGDMELTCLETKMLHWPDSMISYLAADELVFSQDGFGMHLATTERFADQIPEDILEYEGKKYYANILLPFSPFVKKLLKRLDELNLPLKIIAPDHGPIWRENLDWIVSRYAAWADQQPTDKAVVVYDTMWESTAKMAGAIIEGIASTGARAKLMKLRADHRSDVVTEVLDAGAVIVGSPTMNNNIYPTVADLLTYLKGLKPQNKIGAAFGSYGWSGEAAKQVREYLEQMKVEVIEDCEPCIRCNYAPEQEMYKRCFDFGKMIGEKLKELR